MAVKHMDEFSKALNKIFIKHLQLWNATFVKFHIVKNKNDIVFNLVICVRVYESLIFYYPYYSDFH